MKKAISLRLDEDILALVDKVSDKSGWNRTMVLELSIRFIQELCLHSDIPLHQLKNNKYMNEVLVNSYIKASI